MIRSPQALLVSLSLHLLLGAAILAFVVPSLSTVSSCQVVRCSIALSRVVPVMPAMDTETVKRSDKTISSRKAVVEAPAVKKVMVPADIKPAEPKAAAKTAPKSVKSVEPAEATLTKNVEEERQPDRTVQKVATAEAESKEQSVVKAAPSLSEPEKAVPLVQSGDRYVQEHIATIAALLKEYLYYPRMARKRHIEGEVLAVFTLQADGTVRDVSVKKHARAMLDNAAIRTIESLSGRFPHPEGTMTLEVPIRFVLK